MKRKHIAIVLVVTLVFAGVAAGGIAYAEHTDAPPGPGGDFPHPPGTPDADGDRPGVIDADDVSTAGNVTVQREQ